MYNPIEIILHRWEFVQRFSKGVILDLGCKEGDTWSLQMYWAARTNPSHIIDIILADCDVWKIDAVPKFPSRFIRCFAENVPLKDKSVDTVVLAEIIEHTKNPDLVLDEAKRLTRDRIVITTGNEDKWENIPGKSAVSIPKSEYIKKFGTYKDYFLSMTINSPPSGRKCYAVTDDDEFEHSEHLNVMNDQTFYGYIVRNSGEDWNYQIFNIKFSEQNFIHLAAVMWRKQSNTPSSKPWVSATPAPHGVL